MNTKKRKKIAWIYWICIEKELTHRTKSIREYGKNKRYEKTK